MRIRFSLEHLLPLSFFFGFLIAYTIHFKMDMFVLIADYFVKAFLLFAPLIIFIILFTSTCSLKAEREIPGTIAKVSLILYGSLVIISSIFASIVLSIFSKQGPIMPISAGVYSHVLQVIFTSLSRPVSLAILIGFVTPFIFAKTKHFQKILNASRHVYSAQARFFEILIKIFPVFCLSLGATLYYNLGKLAMSAYLISIGSVFVLGMAVLASLSLTVHKFAFKDVKHLSKYSVRAFLAGLSTGSSYITLPMHLKIFNQYFKLDKRVSDFILTLGASLNRCGSVMGVLIVTFVSASFSNYQISWQQMLSLAIPVALIGFGSPGIAGGTLLVNLPAILDVLSPSSPEKFTSTALALFIGGTMFVQVAVNTVANGYVALLVDYVTERTK